MARFKKYSSDQGKFIPIFFDRQILPGTFECPLSYLIENEVDLSVFEERYRNNETGASAYDPAILLKNILFAYSRSFVSSRQIAQCCRKNIIFVALSAGTRPHFTTIAEFLSSVAVGGALLAVSLSHTLWWIRSGMVVIGLSSGFCPVA